MTAPFKIYKSSAGSGKTYTLALDYIALALREPSYYKSILAVTFTNKAMQEMKGRIIEFLDKLAKGEDNTLEEEIVKRTDFDPTDIRVRAGATLSAILHGYSGFAVKTIDSFFQQVLRAFTRELGLQGDFELELDSNKVIEAAIDKLLLDLGKDKDLTNWLVDFVKDRIENDKKYDVKEEIRTLANEIHKEEFGYYQKTLEKLAGKPSIRKFQNKLFQQRNALETEMERRGKEAMQRIENAGFGLDDFSYGKGGVAGFFDKWANGDFAAPGARVLSAADGNGWYKKASPHANAIQQLADDFLQGHLVGMIEYYAENNPKLVSINSILKDFYSFGVILKLLSKIQEYKQEEDILLLADTPPLIREIIGENPTPFIYEKVGTKFQHYLIDEFQDTSALQWENFKPLVTNSIADGSEGLVVGDVKQSIYRWRGGDWKLLLEKVEADIGKGFYEIENLETNWRSLENVIDFNNQLYAVSPDIVKSLVNSPNPENEDIITRAYASAQQTASPKAIKNKNKGAVVIRFFEAEEDENGELNGWKELAKLNLISQLIELQDKGYALKDIALLVRNNSEGNELINYLLNYQAGLEESKYRFDVISKEALAIRDAQVVQCIIHAMSYIHNEDNTISLAALVNTRLRLLTNTDSIWSPSNIDQLKADLPPAFINSIDALGKYSVYELSEQLIEILGLKIKTQFAYLQSFLDAVLAFEKNNVSDLKGFLDWWHLEGHKKSVIISDEQDAIRVLTIHKSKGLQFPVVIIPYANWRLDHFTGGNFRNFLWIDKEANGMLNMREEEEEIAIPMPINYTSNLANSTFAEEYWKEKTQAFMDNLNMLYVATTRAENALYISAAKPKFNKDGAYSINDVGTLLYDCLFNSQANWKSDNADIVIDTESSFFQWGELENAKILDKNVGIQSDEYRLSNINDFPIHSWQERIRLRSRHKALQYANIPEAEERRKYGVLLHDLMAEIQSLQDVEGAILRFQFEGRINEGEKHKLHQLFEQLLADPQIKSWFDSDWEIRNESPVLSPNGNSSRPDRVMLKDGMAQVIDFKTGLEKNEDKLQVASYMALLSSMGYHDVKGFVLYTDSQKIEEVRNG